MTLAELEEGKKVSLAEIAAAEGADAVEALRVKYVGRNGSIPALIKAMKDVPQEERPAFGKAVQAWRKDNTPVGSANIGYLIFRILSEVSYQALCTKCESVLTE